MGRGWFLAILAASILGFVFIGGPAWRHMHDGHFLRITLSYAIIPVGVLAAYAGRWRKHVGAMLAATAILSLVKLVVTAGMLALMRMSA